MVARVRTLAALAVIAAAFEAPAAAQGSDADRERAKRGVVMIEATFPDSTTNSGAGIVVATSGDQVFVVTAKHVVRRSAADAASKINVMFQSRQQWVAADLLQVPNTPLDISALVVKLPAGVNAADLRGVGIAPGSSLRRGGDVYPLGYPNGNRWRVPPRPDTLDVADTLNVTFQTTTLQPGNSGGPLLDACGRVIGMITDHDASEGTAIPIQTVIDTMRRWSLPAPLLLTESLAACVAAPNATSVAEVRRYHDQERWADSLPLLDRLIADHPTSPELRALRAHAYAHLEDIPKSLADGAEAVRLGPAVAEAYLRRGEARLGDQKFKEALADFDAALKLDNNDAEIWANRGAALVATGEPQKALESLNHAIKLRSDRHESWLFRGRIHQALGNRAAALDDFSRALKLQPKNAEIYLARAGVHMDADQVEPALRDVNAADALQRDDPETLTARGAIYMRLRRWDEARKDLTFALSLRPGLKEAAELLRRLDAVTGGSAADNVTPSATAPFSAPPAAPSFGAPSAATGALTYARLIDQATQAFSGQRHAEAAALVDQMIALDPSRPEAWTLFGALAVLADNLAVAQTAYQNAVDRGGQLYFRLAHDHGADQPPCVGTMEISPTAVTYADETGAHRFQWPLASITEAALNDFYGSLVGMFHIRATDGRRSSAFNFAVVRPTDPQVINRRPDAEMIVGFINRLRQAAAR